MSFIIILFFISSFINPLMTQLFDHNDLNTEQQTYTTKQTLLHGTNTILDVLKSTLGPSGNLKFLKDTVTNDGACILKNLLIDSPSASLLINTSISQDKEEGDGTTSVALLSALLHKEAQINIHPLKIIKGYTIALNHIISSFQTIKVESNKFNLAKTTLNSKILNTDLFANICVKASAIDKQHINIIKVPGKLEDSYFDDGFILDRDVDINIENARVLIANTSLDYDKIKIFGAKIQVSSVGELSKLEEAEKDRMRQKIKNICTEDEEVVIDVFLNRQLIYDFPKLEFRKYNVTAIEHCDFSGIENLSKIIGSKILSTFENKEIGICEKIESVRIGDKNMVRFKGKKEAGTIVLFGSKEILEEGERSIHDALCVLRECEMICGGGSVEAYMAHELNNIAKDIEGPESEGVYAFARALMEIPKILADNCGFDGDALKSKLRSAYEKGTVNIGVDLDSGDLGCMKTKGVYESLRMKKSVFVKATETAQMLIKCDGFVKCKPRERGRA